MEERYCVDEVKIVFQAFEKEVILVNLDSGHYYVLDPMAGVIWQAVAAGATVAEIIQFLLPLYPSEQSQLEQAIQEFVAELRQDELILPLDSSAMPKALNSLELNTTALPKPQFQFPTLYKYTEMENLILMDPIRTYDETGWPSRRTFPPVQNP
jgi:hypothetical protein